MTPKWVAPDDQPKKKKKKKDQSLECWFSSQTVSTSQTSELLTMTFKKNLDTKMGGFGRPTEDDNTKKRPVN